MKIAQIAPLCESVPPKLYGGTERIVSFLTEELVRQGHDVTLFASGDSITRAKLKPGATRALRLDDNVRDYVPDHIVMIDQVMAHADDFDILHFHTDYMHFPMARTHSHKVLTTLHGRLDLPEHIRIFSAFPELPLVSISDHQRTFLPANLNWAATVYHGLPSHLLEFQPHSAREYLAFVGRISPEKRPDRAIRIAAAAGMPLKIAAKVDRADRAYWTNDIEPLIRSHPNVEFIGEVNERQKAELLNGAAALLFPIDWPEPFGLVMIEAMACGAPVVAFGCGSVPEIVEEGRSGFIVSSEADAIAAVKKARALDRRQVRAAFDERFSAERMAGDYLDIYARLLDSRRERPRVQIVA